MHTSIDVQLSLDLDAAPAGLVYRPDFIDADEERALVAPLVPRVAAAMHEPPNAVAALLAPRSLYLFGGAARAVWQHTIKPVPALRYSLSFRTRKRAGDPAAARTTTRRTARARRR